MNAASNTSEPLAEGTRANALDAFAGQVLAMVASADHERAQRRAEIESEMTGRAEVELRFASFAESLHARVIRPRVERLAACFEGSRLEHFRTPSGIQSRLVFARSERFPANATLTVGVMLDSARGDASLFQSLELVPILFDFDKAARLEVPIDGTIEHDAARWLDERLLGFVRTYLRLEFDPNYQRENQVIDPVCGMRVSAPVCVYRRRHGHREYAFCSEACAAKFTADPEFYIRNRPQPLDA